MTSEEETTVAINLPKEQEILNWKKLPAGPWSPRRKHTVVLYQDKIFLIGGFDGGDSSYDLNDVWSFDNDWDLISLHAPWSAREGHTAVIFKGYLYIIAGTNDPYFCKNDVWRANSSLNWTLIGNGPFPERWQHACVVHNGAIYILGGWGAHSCMNDVWKSDDGISWKCVCQHAPWNARMFHAAISFKGAIYIMGGYDGITQLNDVWVTTEGRGWIQLCVHSSWDPRQGHSVSMLNDFVYLSGGLGVNGHRYNDVWKSRDCIRWTEVSTNSSWSPRQGHATICFRSSLYVFGGFDGWNYLNDIYKANIASTLIDSLPYDKRVSMELLLSSTSSKSNKVSADDCQRSIMASFSIISSQIKKLKKLREMRKKLLNAIDYGLRIVETGINYQGEQIDDIAPPPTMTDSATAHTPQADATPDATPAMKSTSAVISLTDNATVPLLLSVDSATDNPVTENAIPIQVTSDTAESLELQPDSTGTTPLIPQIDHVDFIPEGGSTAVAATPSGDVVETEFFVDLTVSTSSSNDSLKEENNLTTIITASATNTTTTTATTASAKGNMDSTSPPSTAIVTAAPTTPTVVPPNQMTPATPITSTTTTTTTITASTRKGRKRLKSFHKIRSDEDMKNFFWKIISNVPKGKLTRLRASSLHLGTITEIENTPSSTSTTTMKNTASTKSSNLAARGITSAGLRDFIRQDKFHLLSVQNYVRNAAEEDDEPEMNLHIKLRTDIAEKAYSQAMEILDHFKYVSEMQSKRTEFLKLSLGRLSNIQFAEENELNSELNNNNEFLHCSFAEWESVATNCTAARTAINAKEVDEAISTAWEMVRAHSITFRDLYYWLGISVLIDSENDGYPPPSSEDDIASELVTKFEQFEIAFTVQRLKLSLLVEKEIEKIILIHDGTVALVHRMVHYGKGIINNALSQTTVDSIEISSMIEEVRSWADLCNTLRNKQALDRRCQEYILESAQREEMLVKNEEVRIDTRSHLEKYSLVNKRQSKASEVDSEKVHALLDEYEAKYEQAEKVVRDGKRGMRTWLRDVRKYAINISPELFYYLQDLRAPGSVLGDGGFAETAKLPRRDLTDYDELKIFYGINRPEKKGENHLLLRGKFEGQDIVLKGFVVHAKSNRKGLEKEMSVLSKLKNDYLSSPRAIVEGSMLPDYTELYVSIFLEYPLYSGGDLDCWLQGPHKPWEFQNAARQLLYAIMYIHDHGVIHRDIRPPNILLHEDGRIVLANFDISKELTDNPDDEVAVSVSRNDLRGFMSPEIECGNTSSYASDMYSFGAILFYMHFPDEFAAVIPGHVTVPSTNDVELSDLILALMKPDKSSRPSAAATLNHKYFQQAYVERLLSDGEVVEQDKKLEAIRTLLRQIRSDNRVNLDKIEIRRTHIAEDVLQYFMTTPLERMRSQLRVTFAGEAGIDEGGLLTEMFRLFFEEVCSQSFGLMEGSEAYQDNGGGVEERKGEEDESQLDPAGSDMNDSMIKSVNEYVLPCARDQSPLRMSRLRAMGRAMVKVLYEGRRIGSRLCPTIFKLLTGSSVNIRDLQMFDPQSARSLQWILATANVDDYGLSFESAGAPQLGAVDDSNKAVFVRMKIEYILVESRRNQLEMIKMGFIESIRALSEEASPFMSFLSYTDWRVILCGDTAVSGQQVVAALVFEGYNNRSKIPEWMKDLLLSFSDDKLRSFLVFITGSPSIPTSNSPLSRFTIKVKYQPSSGSLPVAHTCFFHLDLPDYKDKETLRAKLVYAMANALTFDII